MQHIADAKFVREQYQERIQNAERNYRFRHLRAASNHQPVAQFMAQTWQTLRSFAQSQSQPAKPAVHTK